jgi:hypothetical protein
MPTEISTTTAGASEENKFESRLVQTAVLLFAIVVTAFAINSLMSGGMSFADAITGMAQIDPKVISLLSP